MPTCQNCDSFISSDFARVFGNNEGEVYACTECTAFTGLIAGKGAGLET